MKVVVMPLAWCYTRTLHKIQCEWHSVTEWVWVVHSHLLPNQMLWWKWHFTFWSGSQSRQNANVWQLCKFLEQITKQVSNVTCNRKLHWCNPRGLLANTTERIAQTITKRNKKHDFDDTLSSYTFVEPSTTKQGRENDKTGANSSLFYSNNL